jgi:AcrR family transcriptional regulator
MRAIAEEVGVAPPSVYLHFKNRDEIFRAAVLEDYMALADAMRAAGHGSPTARSRLKRMGEAYCEFGIKYPGRYRLITEVQQTQSRRGARHQGHPAEAAQTLLMEAINDCAREERLAEVDDDLAFTCIWCGWHGFVELRRTKPMRSWPDPKRVVSAIVDAVMR